MILRAIRNDNIPFGGVLLLLTMDHTQLAPVQGKPFLVLSHFLSCYKMVRLEYSVRANSDLIFQREEYKKLFVCILLSMKIIQAF